jgi:hypothetical protein
LASEDEGVRSRLRVFHWTQATQRRRRRIQPSSDGNSRHWLKPPNPAQTGFRSAIIFSRLTPRCRRVSSRTRSLNRVSHPVTSLCRALLADDADQALFRKPMLSAVVARKQAAPRPIGRLCSNVRNGGRAQRGFRRCLRPVAAVECPGRKAKGRRGVFLSTLPTAGRANIFGKGSEICRQTHHL